MKKLFIAAGLAVILGMSQTTNHDPTIKYYIKRGGGTYRLENLAKLDASTKEIRMQMLDDDQIALVLKSHCFIMDSLSDGVVRVRIDKTAITFWMHGEYLKKSKK